MNALQFLIFTAIDLFGFILIFRAWFQFSQVDFYNPLSQSLVKITQPVLAPLRLVIPTIKRIDLAALVLAFVLFALKFPLAQWIGAISVNSGGVQDYLIIGGLSLLRNCGKAIFYALLISAIMSWFNRGANPAQYVLYQLTRPLLSPIQRILPNTGMLDFSPMILAFGLFFLDRALYDLFGAYWILASY